MSLGAALIRSAALIRGAALINLVSLGAALIRSAAIIRGAALIKLVSLDLWNISENVSTENSFNSEDIRKIFWNDSFYIL